MAAGIVLGVVAVGGTAVLLCRRRQGGRKNPKTKSSPAVIISAPTVPYGTSNTPHDAHLGSGASDNFSRSVEMSFSRPCDSMASEYSAPNTMQINGFPSNPPSPSLSPVHTPNSRQQPLSGGGIAPPSPAYTPGGAPPSLQSAMKAPPSPANFSLRNPHGGGVMAAPASPQLPTNAPPSYDNFGVSNAQGGVVTAAPTLPLNFTLEPESNCTGPGNFASKTPPLGPRKTPRRPQMPKTPPMRPISRNTSNWQPTHY